MAVARTLRGNVQLRAAFVGARPAFTKYVGQRRSLSDDAASAGLHQTPIVDLLWNRRKVSLCKDSQGIAAPIGKERALITKTSEDSSQSVVYEFTNPKKTWLVDKYRNPWGFVRPGRLFEDLDALAGTIAFEHCRSNNPADSLLHIVTASVDRIKYLQRPSLDDDMVLSGRVTWVGRSSMEIQMRAQSKHGKSPFLESIFTFVARDPATGRAAMINPLKPIGEEQEKLFEMGATRDSLRKEERKRMKTTQGVHKLTDEGMLTAHQLLDEAKPILTMPTLASRNDVLMRDTMLQNTFLTMPQQRNTAGRIFGGFLMRRAYELARSTAHLFGGRRPIFHELDQVTFNAPVNVGDMIKFESFVLYTSEQLDPLGRASVHTEVTAYLLNPEKGTVTTSNVFNFTFGLAANMDGSGGSALGKDVHMRRVLPSSRMEAYRIVERYIADRRQIVEDELTSST